MADYENMKKVKIDDALSRKVLQRLGLESGDVSVRAEEWDLGFCDTCSYPEEGFSVYVNNDLVWPNDDLLKNFGEYIYADSNGYVLGETLSVWGYFFDWLDGKDLGKIRDEEDEFDDDDFDE